MSTIQINSKKNKKTQDDQSDKQSNDTPYRWDLFLRFNTNFTLQVISSASIFLYEPYFCDVLL